MSDKIKSLMNVLGRVDELCKQPGGGINKRSVPAPLTPQKSLLPGTAETDLALFRGHHNTASVNDVQYIISAQCVKPHYKFSTTVSVKSVLNAWTVPDFFAAFSLILISFINISIASEAVFIILLYQSLYCRSFCMFSVKHINILWMHINHCIWLSSLSSLALVPWSSNYSVQIFDFVSVC